MNVRPAYLALTIAYVSSFLALIPLLGSPPFTRGWALALTLSLLVAVPLTLRQWRRNRRTTAMFIIVMLVVPFVSALGTASFYREGLAASLLVAATTGLGLFLMGRTLWFEQHLPDRLPNRLSEQFLDADTFEDDGVQWAVQCTGNDPATALDAVVHLQNNIDAERIVSIRIEAQTPFFGGGETLRFAPLAPVTLPASADATVTIPFVASETRPRRRIDAYVFLTVKGPPGPRNRRQRAAPAPRPTSRWLVLFAPLAGHFISQRGGVRIALRSSGAASPSLELADATVELREVPKTRELFGGVVQLP